jgi:hypothetical protein
MLKTLVLALLLLSAAGLQAQQTPSSETHQAPAEASALTIIQGCLQSTAGIYTLTENDGTVHRLSRYANKLSPHVGQEVQITGAPGVKTISTTQQNIASSAIEIPVFNVKTVTRIADSCKSPGKSLANLAPYGAQIPSTA